MKLKTKIQVFSSLFLLIILLFVNTAVYFLFYKSATDSQLVELSLQTDVLSERLTEATDEIEASQVIEAFLPANGMGRVYSEDEGVILFKYGGEAYPDFQGSFQREESQDIVRPERGVHVSVVWKPIIWHDGSVVTLELSDTLVELSNTMTTLFYVLIAASLILLIPVVIASNILSRILLNPIEQLTQTMKENSTERKWKKIEHSNSTKDELYEMEATFNEMIDQLRDSYERQENFVSNASHELKTPIQIVKSYAELLRRRGKDNPEIIEESIQAIDSEADRMKQLVEQLLALAKQKEKKEHERIELVHLVIDAVDTFRQAYHREIDFQTNVDRVYVLGHIGQLEQVVYSLMENALKYSDKQIVVSLFTFQGEVIFSVKDYGSGIAKEDQDRIFERFYRVDKARSRETGGTGLGLSIALAIALDHSGDLTVESSVGEGSTFSLSLPVLKEESEQ